VQRIAAVPVLLMQDGAVTLNYVVRIFGEQIGGLGVEV